MEMPSGFKRCIEYLEKTLPDTVNTGGKNIHLYFPKTDLATLEFFMKEMAEVLEKFHEQLLDEYDGVDHWIEEMQVMKKFREWK